MEKMQMDLLEEYSRANWQMIRGVPMTKPMAMGWERVDQFQVRPDDLFIASYPKSGTTWMSEIMDLILNNGDVEKCQRDAVFMRVMMMEIVIPSKPPGTEILSRMPSPRLLRTHLPIKLLPKSFWENDCKVVYVARNAKDVAVSYYHFSLANILHPDPGTWEQYLENFMAGKVGFGSWHEHVKGWWEKKKDLRLLYLFYEDMKEDLEREIRKLLAFLEKDLEEEVVQKIVQRASFQVMKENPMANYKTVQNDVYDQTVSAFMRKGICGDWKNHFTVAQNEKFDEDYALKMAGTTLSFRTEI